MAVQCAEPGVRRKQSMQGPDHGLPHVSGARGVPCAHGLLHRGEQRAQAPERVLDRENRGDCSRGRRRALCARQEPDGVCKRMQVLCRCVFGHPDHPAHRFFLRMERKLGRKGLAQGHSLCRPASLCALAHLCRARLPLVRKGPRLRPVPVSRLLGPCALDCRHNHGHIHRARRNSACNDHLLPNHHGNLFRPAGLAQLVQLDAGRRKVPGDHHGRRNGLHNGLARLCGNARRQQQRCLFARAARAQRSRRRRSPWRAVLGLVRRWRQGRPVLQLHVFPHHLFLRIVLSRHAAHGLGRRRGNRNVLDPRRRNRPLGPRRRRMGHGIHVPLVPRRPLRPQEPLL
eukprot:comp15160_c0_seq1/m.22693 comp15160_c0_seq1/g.22693  ORF comp15160_c0_seq1/g.22693 comp15160_c0_seq1/m.22693 type:complete len:343 (+) comp15160_c0_seq1:233-1261(+)